MNVTVYRVQHTGDGRGPWRPGFTDTWSSHKPLPPPWFDEFPHLSLEIGWYYGSAVLNVDDLALWFTASELSRLLTLGYHVVAIDDAEVVAESDTQVVFRRRTPHRKGLSVVDLGVIEVAR